MKLTGEFKFVGCEARPSFYDPSKMSYVVGLAQGLDTLRCYVKIDLYTQCKDFEPYSDVVAELDYNPVKEKYNMNLVGISN